MPGKKFLDRMMDGGRCIVEICADKALGRRPLWLAGSFSLMVALMIMVSTPGRAAFVSSEVDKLTTV